MRSGRPIADVLANLLRRAATLEIYRRIEKRARDAGLRPRFFDPRRRGAQIVIVAQSFAGEILQHRILEKLPPGKIR